MGDGNFEVESVDILVVDDHSENLKTLSAILNRDKYKVRLAQSGPQALRSVKTKPPNLILLDIRMPEMGGYEVCRRLKQDKISREIPIIFISALHEPMNKVKAFEVGGVDYIEKPFNSEEVIARINTHLKLRQLQKELQKHSQTLEKQVDVRTAQLAERTVELSKANQLLLGEIEEREQIGEKLKQAERKYRTVADFTYDWEYWANFDDTLEYVSPSCERISGYSVQEFIENPALFREIIVPEDSEIWDQHVLDSKKDLTLKEIQFRIKKKDGEIRWIEHACQPVIDDQGSLRGFRASNRDITVRKQSEEALQASREKTEMLGTKLLSAQEAEHARLARELHDDISQRLAFLNIEIDKLEMRNESLPEPVRETLRQIARNIGALSSDIHLISRRLHPVTLEVLGLVRSIEAECRNLTGLKEIPVTLDLDGTLQNVSKEISLCIYRILQEGLRNIVRHARATGVHVSLSKKNDILHLLIKDNGVGFDEASGGVKAGLGIASMTERALLVRGALSIESQPGKGTAIKLAVPLESRNEA